LKIPLMMLVPARGGSKRLPNKNIKNLGGRTLIKRVADVVKLSKINGPLILSTDSKLIADEGLKEGMQVPFMRPDNISTDKSPTIDAVIHALDWFKNKNGTDPEMVMILQPTSPFRNEKMLTEALECLQSRKNIDSVISMSPLKLSTNHIYNINTESYAEPISLEDINKVYFPNGAVYLTRTKALRRDHSLFAGKIYPLITDLIRSIDVDNAYDWMVAESLLKTLEKNLPSPR